MSDRKRLLNDLRVIDLRAELEKRNLDKSGVRAILMQRLSKSLEEEGLDPTTFKFEIAAPENKSPSKKARRSESTAEAENEETPVMEDMIVQDDAGDEEENADDSNTVAEAEEKMEVEETKSNRKREIKEESECTQAKKPCLDKTVKNDDDQKAIENNTDAEDSINLDLGEDELLNEETDHNAKIKKEEETEDAAEAPRGDTAGDEDDADKDSAATGDVKEEVNTDVLATSEGNDEKKDKDSTDDKEKDDGDKKEKKEDGKEGGARNLWVSGLSGDTRAKDLKQLCSKHGKVIGAKVVTNARTPGSRCYGYVTMASPQDAENCIKNLHRTELHGRMISVEKAKSEADSTRRQARHNERRPSADRSDAKKEGDDEGKEGAEKGEVKKEGEASGGDSARSISENRDKTHTDKDRGHRTRSRERRRSPREVLSFSKIWKERDIARARERSRAAREEERRRRAAEDALRERERRQRQEKHRLELEREKLRAEREKIEREKNELLRLERERHRLEREKLELERLELKRAQLRLEEEQRKRSGYDSSAAYRKSVPSPQPAYERDARHKRPPPPPMMSSRGQFEAPAPPRFDMPAPAYDRSAPDKRGRDYKRDYPRHVSSGNIKYPSNGSTNDDSRQPLPPGTRPKEPGRSYESRESRSYRPSPPSKPEPRAWNTSSRYQESGPPSKTGGSEPWSSSSGGGETRYGSSATSYDQRYPPAFQPPPPGTAYTDRYQPPPRDYRAKF